MQPLPTTEALSASPGAVDTLICDSARLATWRANPDYHYNRELVAPEVSLTELLNQWMKQFLRTLFGDEFAANYTGEVLIGITLLLLLGLLWFLYRQRPELFQRARRNPLPYRLHEDTIYGVDFVQALTAALQRADYHEAIRLLYLQTLKQLADRGQIDWQPYQTPTDYTYQVRAESWHPSFCELTDHFLQIRYGNFEATDSTFHRMKQLQQLITESMNPPSPTTFEPMKHTSPSATEQKGANLR